MQHSKHVQNHFTAAAAAAGGGGGRKIIGVQASIDTTGPCLNVEITITMSSCHMSFHFCCCRWWPQDHSR
jgi:hypothetical protein